MAGFTFPKLLYVLPFADRTCQALIKGSTPVMGDIINHSGCVNPLPKIQGGACLPGVNHNRPGCQDPHGGSMQVTRRTILGMDDPPARALQDG